MRWIERGLLIIGFCCLATYGWIYWQAQVRQSELRSALDRELAMAQEHKASTATAPKVEVQRPLVEGDLVGRLEVPRLNLSVMVMEGTTDQTLRLGAGHIPNTPLPGRPGNTGIAGHRDTFFRDIRDIKKDDLIRLTTTHRTLTYRVIAMLIVAPDDVAVLQPTSRQTITLVTCYPFYYIGPAPKRFVVQATLDETAGQTTNLLNH
jgi:sortase A